MVGVHFAELPDALGVCVVSDGAERAVRHSFLLGVRRLPRVNGLGLLRVEDGHAALPVGVDVVALVFGLDDEFPAPAEKPLALKLAILEAIADFLDGDVGQKLCRSFPKVGCRALISNRRRFWRLQAAMLRSSRQS